MSNTDFNSDIALEIVVGYESGVSAIASKTVNIVELALDIHTRNEIAKASGQAIYNRADAEKLEKYLASAN